MTAYQLEPVGWCPAHRKLLYGSRRAARRACRLMRWEKGLREYRCTAVDGAYHLGHLPQATRYGLKTTREVYGGAA